MKAKKTVRFVSKDKNQFFGVLKKRVDAYFLENDISKNGNASMVIKTIVLITAYVTPFVAILTLQLPFGTNLLLWAVMGIALAGIGMSVMHDANHGAYSTKEWVNTLVGYSITLLGGSMYNWKLQHNNLHHMYTNIIDVDDDIADKLVLKFSPHTPAKKFHKYQPFYAFFFYGLLSIYWALAKDFIQYARYIGNGVNTKTKKENKVFLIRMIVDKVAYFFVFLGVPTLFFKVPFGEVFAGFMLMHFIGGFILTLIFQMAHAVEEADHPLPNAAGNIENDWAIHQLNTTVNFSRHNKPLSWYVGGLNYQVEHHLFPKICHVHYPALAPIVKQTAEEYGIAYLENETFWKAFQSHFSVLQQAGKMPSLNEALA